MSQLLEGKKAIVTGASSGIGLGIAKVFAREGADLIITCRENTAGMDAALAQLRAHGVKATGIQADLSRIEEIDRVFDAAGAFDILVNNAGTTERCPFLEVTPAMFERVYGINARGTFFCAQRAARMMLKQGHGRIINVSTFQTENVTGNSSVYVSTKGAIDQMTRTLAFELAPHNIQVLTLSPGFVPVEKEPLSEADRAKYKPYIPYGRFGLPEDIGETAAFLASDRCKFMTGANIIVDGGQSVPLYFPPR
ncbi:MAG: 3-oxoacyl-[acyl-carrier-protein] reductase FabG [Verrucomicrobiae bacterium]|nr:3-oxoacyl-[acyl-carrier-protein] reductase FabG [Verrucomicrobiae bacterium]